MLQSEHSVGNANASSAQVVLSCFDDRIHLHYVPLGRNLFANIFECLQDVREVAVQNAVSLEQDVKFTSKLVAQVGFALSGKYSQTRSPARR